MTDEVFKDLMKSEVLPNHDPKYETMRNTQWRKINEAFNMCCKFDPNVRPTAIEVLTAFLKKEHDVVILEEGNI